MWNNKKGTSISPYVRIMDRTVEGPIVREGLGPCLDCTYRDNGLGYRQIKYHGRGVVASRVVLEHKLGRPLGDGMRALHHCDRRGCVREEHLYEGTQKDNMRDMAERNPSGNVFRGRHGERHFRAKLTDDIVRDLRRRVASGHSIQSISKDLGIPRSTIFGATSGRTWNHVQ